MYAPSSSLNCLNNHLLMENLYKDVKERGQRKKCYDNNIYEISITFEMIHRLDFLTESTISKYHTAVNNNYKSDLYKHRPTT